MNTPDWQTALRGLLKESEIVDDAAALLIDQRRRYTGQADMVVQPHSVAAVQAVMKFCHEHRIPVTPQGGNTGLCEIGRAHV